MNPFGDSEDEEHSLSPSSTGEDVDTVIMEDGMC